jgi:predicted nucleic acid-binding protein
MGSDPGYLIDTNILLRISRFGDPLHQVVKAALDELRRRDVALYFSLQNVAEFWNVCTRPTLNQPDFARYSNIHTVHPSQLQVSIP